MDWHKVADRLNDEADVLRANAPAGFPNDFVTQREMLTRAAIYTALADAFRAGAGPAQPAQPPH
jgi:hypothetical protein